MAKAAEITRLYRGARIEERRAERRSQLIDAAIKVYGEVGYRNATVKAVCEKAKLTERYFYESFDNSEALLIAAYAHVTTALHQEMAKAGEPFGGDDVALVTAVLRVYFACLRQQPQPARVFLLEIAGISPAVDMARMQALKAMSNVLVPGNPPAGKESGLVTLSSAGMIGAVINIALRWVAHGYAQPLEDVVATAVDFCRVALSGKYTKRSAIEGRPRDARKSRARA